VELDDGRLMVIVQEKDDEFAVGDRIRLLQSPDGKMRIRQYSGPTDTVEGC